MKRLLSLLLVFSLLVLPVSAAVYDDVSPNAWYAVAVDEVSHRGIMTGTSDTTFSPNAPMSRGMLATTLNRLAGEPHSTAGLFFQDVEAGTWYIDSVIWCDEMGYMEGTDATHFSPSLPLPREELACVVVRYVGRRPGARSDISGFAGGGAGRGWAHGGGAG
ncbi:MAG: S-layer homology domain-containing protein, partial [Oscillospiraceae bacterium]